MDAQSFSCVVHTRHHGVLTFWGRDKMAAISQTTFSNAFSWMKMQEFRLRFNWNMFERFEVTNFQHWFSQCFGATQVTSHYLNQWWLFSWRIHASLGLDELMLLPHRLHHHLVVTNVWCSCRGCIRTPFYPYLAGSFKHGCLQVKNATIILILLPQKQRTY